MLTGSNNEGGAKAARSSGAQVKEKGPYVVVGLLCVVVLIMVAALSREPSEFQLMTRAAEKYAGHVARGEWPAAYALTTPEYRSRVSLEDFTRLNQAEPLASFRSPRRASLTWVEEEAVVVFADHNRPGLEEELFVIRVDARWYVQPRVP